MEVRFHFRSLRGAQEARRSKNSNHTLSIVRWDIICWLEYQEPLVVSYSSLLHVNMRKIIYFELRKKIWKHDYNCDDESCLSSVTLLSSENKIKVFCHFEGIFMTKSLPWLSFRRPDETRQVAYCSIFQREGNWDI